MPLILLTAASLAVLAHSAPSGWDYDSECCGGHDCRPIAADAVLEKPTAWEIRATGELIMKYSAKVSKDGDFHRCSYKGLDDAKTFCLYVPLRGV